MKNKRPFSCPCVDVLRVEAARPMAASNDWGNPGEAGGGSEERTYGDAF